MSAVRCSLGCQLPDYQAPAPTAGKHDFQIVEEGQALNAMQRMIVIQ